MTKRKFQIDKVAPSMILPGVRGEQHLLTDRVKKSIEKSPLLMIEYCTIVLLETFLIYQEEGQTEQMRIL